MPVNPVANASAVTVGTLCGVAAALCWAMGFTVAKYGLAHGMTAPDLALHRFAWSGLLMLPLLARQGLGDLGGIGWRRGIALMLLAGPPQAYLAYVGFSLVPLGHGAVIQPAMATLAGVVLSALVLGEHLTPIRIFGIVTMIVGLLVFGAEALASFGSHGISGDLLFVMTGSMWACFSVLLRRWSVSGIQASVIVSVLALFFLVPVHGLLFGYEAMIAAGFAQNLLQALVQGALAGAIPIYLYAHAVTKLGAGRASIFTALVPMFAMILGVLLIAEIPTLMRIVGLAIVVVGFRFAIKP
ncbi:MAG: DMT family transporter [Pseudorhodoplanes sp.]|nr:DMT family transporter [Pseudorhodoplanes sp.]